MRGKSVALLILALGCGLVAAVGITQVLAHRGNDAPPVETVTVIEAATEIPPYAVVTAEMLKSEEWPQGKVPPGAIVRNEDVVGRCAKGRMFAGELILDPKLLPRGERPIDVAIPKGFRVVTVAVELVSSNAGLVLPNSRVDLQLYVRKGQDPSIAETMTQTILQDVKVFAVNDVMNADAKNNEKKVNSIQSRTVSLLVTPQQAGIITAASELGTLRLIMRSADDREQPKIAPVTPRGLLVVNDGTNRKDEEHSNEQDEFGKMYKDLQDRLREAQLKKPSAPEPARWAMRLVSAGDVHDVVLQTYDNPDDAIWAAKGMPERHSAPPPAPVMPAVAPAAPVIPANASLAVPPNAAPAIGAALGTSAGTSGKQNLFNPSSPAP